MKIDLKKICKKKTITRKDGEKIKSIILEAWDKEKMIRIDFNNILIASVSFIDEAFGKLAFDYPKEALRKKLSFENIEKYDKALLNDILLSRYKQSDLGENGKSR
jgi:hypothetical protein